MYGGRVLGEIFWGLIGQGNVCRKIFWVEILRGRLLFMGVAEASQEGIVLMTLKNGFM